MSDQEIPRENHKLPYFTKEYKEWIIEALVLHSPRDASELFLREYSEFNEYGTKEHVLSVIQSRFEDYVYRTDSPKYEKIKQHKKMLEDTSHEFYYLDFFPFASALGRLSELHELLDCHDELTVSQMRRILSEIRTEVSRIEKCGTDIDRVRFSMPFSKFEAFMSDHETELEEEISRENRKVPKFTTQYDEWIVNALSLHSLRYASVLFLRHHPAFSQYGSREYVLSVIRSRFEDYVYRTDSPKYEKIKQRKKMLKERKMPIYIDNLYEMLSFTGTLKILSELHEWYEFEERLTLYQRLRILRVIRIEVDRIVGPDCTLAV